MYQKLDKFNSTHNYTEFVIDGIDKTNYTQIDVGLYYNNTIASLDTGSTSKSKEAILGTTSDPTNSLFFKIDLSVSLINR